eukprot:2886426-Rhodomonas_salina.1
MPRSLCEVPHRVVRCPCEQSVRFVFHFAARAPHLWLSAPRKLDTKRTCTDMSLLEDAGAAYGE